MTPQQNAVLLAAYSLLSGGSSPTTKEIAALAGLHPGNISSKLYSLADAGYAEIVSGRDGVLVTRATLPDGRSREAEEIVFDREFRVNRYSRDLQEITAAKIARKCIRCRTGFRASRRQHICAVCHEEINEIGLSAKAA